MLEYASLYHFMRVYDKMTAIKNPQKTFENQHILLKPLYINDIRIENRIWVAPMAGGTD